MPETKVFKSLVDAVSWLGDAVEQALKSAGEKELEGLIKNLKLTPWSAKVLRDTWKELHGERKPT